MAAGAVAAATVASLGPTTATAATARPDTPVASNGSTVKVAERASVAGVNSYAGTGKTVNSKSNLKAGQRLSGAAVQPESIFGTDNRIRINPTTTFPARATVMITRNGNAHCSGWLINANTVATAGHCVHSGGSGGSWYSGLTAWPGRNGSSAPYGGCTVKTTYSVAGWVSNGDQNYDYGALKLNCNIGNNTGWYGYWWQSASLKGTSTLVQGYPGEKPFGEQWRGDNVSRTVQENNSTKVWYNNDTTGGMSGSPVFQNRPAGSSFCVGVCAFTFHAYGIGGSSYPSNKYNSGTRITEARFNNLQAWKAAS